METGKVTLLKYISDAGNSWVTADMADRSLPLAFAGAVHQAKSWVNQQTNQWPDVPRQLRREEWPAIDVDHWRYWPS